MQSFWLIAALIGTALLILLAVFYSMRLRKTSDKRAIEKIISNHCKAVEHDATFSDGLDGYLFVDYLMLLHGKIVVMKVMTESGYIFGSEGIDEWTCVKNNRTGKFNNPLKDTLLSVQQIRHTLKFDAVEACVLFGSHSEFPKSMPQGVVRLADFDAELESYRGSDDADEAAQDAWEQLIVLVHGERKNLSVDLQS
ncbi:MAG: nuclease-related domain-containing protein [Mariprofundaceae bacterium]